MRKTNRKFWFWWCIFWIGWSAVSACINFTIGDWEWGLVLLGALIAFLCFIQEYADY